MVTAISLQKLHPLSDSSFIIGDLMVRRSSTEQTVFFPAAGIFPNSSDNRQFSASLTYVKVLGVDGKFTFHAKNGLQSYAIFEKS